MLFKSIEFGELSAEEEIESSPNLVLDGFYDFKEILNNIFNGKKFLILGNKGSGKSIVGEHIKLLSEQTGDGKVLFVQKYGMKDFPYKSFSKIIPGNDEVENKLATAWKWSLLVKTILSFEEDKGKEKEFDHEYCSAVDNLRRLGIIPAATLSQLAKICSAHDFKVKIMDFEISSHEEKANSTDLMFAQIITHLMGVAKNLQSPNKHFIIIDGLDDQLSQSNNQFLAIASLVEVSLDLNRFFSTNNVPLKILILCRKDIYSNLPGANKNKMKSYTEVLNWYEDQIDHKEKNIIKLAQFRAKISNKSKNIFEENFEENYYKKDAYDYILQNTRYTPRDFLQLLNYLKEFKTPGKKFTADEIEKAVKKYSTEYFWPEVEDELDGYFQRSEINKLKLALIDFNKREFLLHDFEIFCTQKNYLLTNLEKMFKVMYDCGAISNKTMDSKFYSKMRDENDFNPRIKIVINRGAFKALSLV